MSYYEQNPYQSAYADPSVAALAGESERTTFIRRTYLHLAGAIFAFVGIEALLFMFAGEAVGNIVRSMSGGWNWLFVLGAFMVVSWIAQSWAVSATSLTTQYMGLGLYVVAEAVIFLPLLYVARMVGDETILAAALITGIVFGGLTMIVFTTRADLSGLGTYLWLGGLVALGVIVASIVTGAFGLGVIFSGCMIALASGYILYHTSNVLHHYRTDQYVAAALALFASVAILVSSPQSRGSRAVRRYVLANLVASALLLTGVALAYGATGTVNLAQLGEDIKGVAPATQASI
ncbi:MAG: Bax inhibitor-1 family protein, partial [Planctomycetes bacterium]|nr:Bax inhibitor-1 family protein [Planctomycetota bacterium]